MASTTEYINGASLDGFNNVWAVGRDLTKFDGSVWSYYDSTNSVVPSNIPYYLDTRSISIDEDSTKWVGCAYTPSLSTPLIFSAVGPFAATGASWTSLEVTGATGQSLDVPTIYASPFGYTVSFDMLPIQKAIDGLASTIQTNQEAFGVQNVLVPRGSNLDVEELVGGLNIVQYDPKMGKPEPMNLTATPVEIFNRYKELINEMESISGINSVVRGNPEASLKSGAALALVASQAIRALGKSLEILST
jgi:hypothetical protein